MVKVLNITTLKESKSDYFYWSEKSYQERLDAIEFLRDQYMNFNTNAKQRLQRVCRIINRNKKASGRLRDLDDLQNLGD